MHGPSLLVERRGMMPCWALNRNLLVQMPGRGFELRCETRYMKMYGHAREIRRDLGDTMQRIGEAARAAAGALATAPRASKDRALNQAAAAVRGARARLIDANALDIEMAKKARATDAFIDRVTLDDARVEGIARGLEAIAAQPDPVGHVHEAWTRPNGLEIARVAVPFGVVGIIYEARPNVTADAGGLCLKSGNAAILRGGAESFEFARRSWSTACMKACVPRTCRRRRCSSCRRATARRSATC